VVSLGQFADLALAAKLLVLRQLATISVAWVAPALTSLVIVGTVLVIAVLARLQYRKLRTLTETLESVRHEAQQLGLERDQARQELWPRLVEERELHKQKIQFEAQLAEYEKYAALARLALGAAHEINNPLLGILSHLELELQETTDADQRTEIEQCIAGAKRISSTLRGLVNYARPGPLMLSRITVYNLVSEALSYIEGQPMLRGKEVENLVPPDLPPILADSSQLSQVLMNLLLNAAEATPEGGKITISADKLTYVDLLEIRIADTGTGIPADVLPHVFEPFFTTKRGKGTGLGLSISQAYIRSHNGEIRVDSVPDHGTTVTITLPIRQGNDAEETKEDIEVIV